MANYELERLRNEGPAPAMEYLLPRIEANTHATYGEIAAYLEHEWNLDGKIFPTHIGYVAGPLQDQINDTCGEEVPLLNALIVRADSAQAGVGIDGYLRRRYLDGARRKFRRDERDELLSKASQEVYAYGIDRWRDVFAKTFGRRPSLAQFAELLVGTERDGQERGGPAESAEHRRLKEYVFNKPAVVGLRSQTELAKMEFPLLSGDEVDVVFIQGLKVWLVEVKSSLSSDSDLRRGVYQCIKYAAVYKAHCYRTMPETEIVPVLVTQRPLPPELAAIAKDFSVRCKVIADVTDGK